MRLTTSSSNGSVAHLRLKELSVQRDILDNDDGRMIAHAVVDLLNLMPQLDVKGQIAKHRLLITCRAIIKKAPS